MQQEEQKCPFHNAIDTFLYTYTDDNFRIIGQGRSSFHLSVLESVYIKTQNPVLCKLQYFMQDLYVLYMFAKWARNLFGAAVRKFPKGFTLFCQ